MTAARRTLEEIEALASEATPGPWWVNPEFRADLHCEYGCIAEIIDFDAVHPDSFASEQQQLGNAALIAALPDLLAIAQEQRAALLAIWPFVEEDDGLFTTPEYQAAINQVREILWIGTKK